MAHRGVLKASKRELKGLDIKQERGMLVAHATCECGDHKEIGDKRSLPPHAWLKRFKDTGWTFTKKNPVCANCSQKRSEEMNALKQVHPTANDDDGQPSPAARRAKRYAIMALEDAYEEGIGYKKGFDDASVAIEAGCSEKQVALLREELFGPAAPPMPPEIAKAVEEMGQLRAQAATDRDQAEERLSAVIKLQTNLQTLIRNNGWRS